MVVGVKYVLTREKLGVVQKTTIITDRIIDIEAVFLFPWAILYKKLGLFGLIEMMVFLLILGVGLAYVWIRGGLDWE